MYTVPVAGAWWHAVGAQLERVVRPHSREAANADRLQTAPESILRDDQIGRVMRVGTGSVNDFAAAITLVVWNVG